MLNCQITQTTCFILPSVKTIICKSILLSFFFWHKIWVKYDSDGFSDPINVQTFLMLRLGVLSVSGFFKGGGGECFWSAFIKFDWQMTEPWKLLDLTLSDMGFFEPSVIGGRGAWGPHHNFVVIALMIMKFDTDIKVDVFYSTATKTFVTSLLSRNYDVIACILADT